MLDIVIVVLDIYLVIGYVDPRGLEQGSMLTTRCDITPDHAAEVGPKSLGPAFNHRESWAANVSGWK